MIIALLYQTDQISPKKLGNYAFIGELSLDGRIRPCNGVLSMVIEARKSGIKAVVVPFENRQEACSVTGIKICPVKLLKDTIRLLEDRVEVTQQGEIDNNKDSTLITVDDYTDSKESDIDFADVKGQDDLIETIVLGASGGHNILMLGEPGCGKTMIAQRLPTILHSNIFQ